MIRNLAIFAYVYVQTRPLRAGCYGAVLWVALWACLTWAGFDVREWWGR